MLARTLAVYRNSFTGLSKETWLLSLVILINRSGTMVVPFLTLYLTGKGMHRSLSDAGLVMGLFGLGAFTGAYFSGKLCDRTGFNKVQLFTLFFGDIMFIVLGQVKSFPLICGCTFILSLINEAFRPANSAAIAFYSKPQNRTRSYSLNRLAVNLGWAIGSSAGGLIASYNYELLFWVDGLTNIGAAFLLFYFLKPSVSSTHQKPKEQVNRPASAYRDKRYLFFILLVTLFACCFFQMFTTIPKYFRDNLFLSERFIGFIMALNGLFIVAVEMVLVYHLEKRNRYSLYITAGTIICGLSYFSLLIPGNAKAVTLLMILFITMGEIISMPFMNTFWILRSNEGNRGQYAALYTMAWSTGQTLGPLLFSRLADAKGFPVLFVVMGVMTLLTAIGFYRLHKTQVV